MFCPECGNRIEDQNIHFCPECGARIEQESNTEKKAPRQTSPSRNEYARIDFHELGSTSRKDGNQTSKV